MQPLKYPGGKHYLGKTIYALMPPHKFRLIPFAGGLGEFWGWPCEGVSDCVNDLDSLLWNFYSVLKDPALFEAFHRVVQMTPFGRQFWEEAGATCRRFDAKGGPSVEAAAAYLVLVRQSMMGLQKTFAPLSINRVRREMNEQASAWLSAVEGLPEAHARISRVAVENLPAVQLLRKYDRPGVVVYADPPYYPGTREMGLYRHEMTEQDHEELLDCLLEFKGKVILSGYSCPRYLERLKDWSVRTVELPNAMQKSGQKDGRVEHFWANYPLPEDV